MPYLLLPSSLRLFHLSSLSLSLSLTACVNGTANISIAYDFFTPFQAALAPSLPVLCGDIPNEGRSTSSWLCPRASSICPVNLSLLQKRVLLLDMSSETSLTSIDGGPAVFCGPNIPCQVATAVSPAVIFCSGDAQHTTMYDYVSSVSCGGEHCWLVICFHLIFLIYPFLCYDLSLRS